MEDIKSYAIVLESQMPKATYKNTVIYWLSVCATKVVLINIYDTAKNKIIGRQR